MLGLFNRTPDPIGRERNERLLKPQRTLTYFVRGGITVRVTSCLTGLDSTKLVNLYLIQQKQSS